MSEKKKPKEGKEVFYRDGIPIAEKSPGEQESIYWRHVNPDDADYYNPAGQTVGATVGVAINFHGKDLAARNGRKVGGRLRGKQQETEADRKWRNRVYEHYKALVADGVSERDVIRKTTEQAQLDPALCDLELGQRQVRRAVDRLKQRDSS